MEDIKCYKFIKVKYVECNFLKYRGKAKIKIKMINYRRLDVIILYNIISIFYYNFHKFIILFNNINA